MRDLGALNLPQTVFQSLHQKENKRTMSNKYRHSFAINDDSIFSPKKKRKFMKKKGIRLMVMELYNLDTDEFLTQV